ncbi:hypothetical protein ACN27G_06000 [Plantactinospora sp. WMMB334]|uniref:hypothetical protein n=1 Tax=Plantactinospora sp. WMMB334 TaxID=3404119 RepID=UPI003B93F97A
MAEILSNVRLFVGGADLTGVGNKLEVAGEAEEKNVTRWSSYDEASGLVWKEVLGGTKSAKISGAGFWEAGDEQLVDDVAWEMLAATGELTAYPRGAGVGAPAWVTKALETQYQLLGQQGEVAPWSASWSNTWPLARGVVAHPPGTARTATGDGTAVPLPAVPTGGELIAVVHVLSVAGTGTPSLTVAIESDDTDDFDGSETTRITFPAATAVGGLAVRVGGPITDTFYRATWTITGSSPSFLFLVAFGVA